MAATAKVAKPFMWQYGSEGLFLGLVPKYRIYVLQITTSCRFSGDGALLVSTPFILVPCCFVPDTCFFILVPSHFLPCYARFIRFQHQFWDYRWRTIANLRRKALDLWRNTSNLWRKRLDLCRKTSNLYQTVFS